MKLLVYPKDCEKLQRPSSPVTDRKSAELHQDKMYALMLKLDGLALAAPQVGIFERFFVAREDLFGQKLILNPVVLARKGKKVLVTEGCLSFPSLYVKIPRYERIEISIDGSNSIVLSGLAAQVFQHETDHLDGVLLIDRLSKGK